MPHGLDGEGPVVVVVVVVAPGAGGADAADEGVPVVFGWTACGARLARDPLHDTRSPTAATAAMTTFAGADLAWDLGGGDLGGEPCFTLACLTDQRAWVMRGWRRRSPYTRWGGAS
jgi:hypothetical protein